MEIHLSKNEGELSLAVAGMVYMAAHVFSETFLIGICGIELDLVVLLMDTGAYLTAGLVVGAILAFLSGYWKSSGVRGKGHQWKYLLLLALFAGALLVYTVLAVVYRSSASVNYLLVMVLLAGFVNLIRHMFKGINSVAKVFLHALTLFFLLNAFRIGTLFSTELQFSGGSTVFYCLIFAPFVFFTILLEFASRYTSARSAAGVRPFLLTTCVLIVLQMVSWFSFFPLERGWGVVKHEKATGVKADRTLPNIILVIFDSLRADYLELFGCASATMPNLTRLAREEADYVSLTRAHSSWTLPSHASIFTGKYPSSHGAHGPKLNDSAPPAYAYPLGPKTPTIAGQLARIGYSTIAISSNYSFLNPRYGLNRGFHYFDARPGRSYLLVRLSIIRGGLNHLVHYITINESAGLLQPLSEIKWFNLLFTETNYRNATKINHAVGQQLQESGYIREPFFLFINYMEPHFPYLPPPEFKKACFEQDDETSFEQHPSKYYYEAYRALKSNLPSDACDKLKALYKAELSYLDWEFGELIAELKRTGRYENTIIIISSDHGEAFGEHKFLKHGNSLYDPEILVPLIIVSPASIDSSIDSISGSLQHVDLFPTIAALVGVKIPGELDGSPYGIEHEYLLSELFITNYNADTPYDLRAISGNNYKLVKYSGGEKELFNLKADPAEQLNICRDSVRVAQEMSREIERWEKKFESLYSRSRRPFIHPEDLQQLKSLGYIK